MSTGAPLLVPADVQGYLVALAIGLLIGVERERSKASAPGDGHQAAGVRTFPLIALVGALAAGFGPVGIAVGGAFVVMAAMASYRRTRDADPGLTTEVALVVTFLLGLLAMDNAALAGALGVVVAVVLASKSRLHRFTRELLTSQELHDGLLLAAAAVIVLPLLPDRAIDPWGALNLHTLWTLVVVVMAINGAGYVALRLLGPRAGLPLAGFAGGFVSSTATIAAMGDRSRAAPALLPQCVSGALFSNIATVLMLAVVIGALSMPTLGLLAVPLACAGVAALTAALLARGRTQDGAADGTAVAPGRPFEPRQAVMFAVVVSVILLLAALVHRWLGDTGLMAAAAVSGLADVHAASASVAQLVAAGQATPHEAQWPVALALLTNSCSKLLMAWLRGGTPYAARLLPGLVLILLAFAAGAWLA